MWEAKILINSVDKVKDFNNKIFPFSCEMDLLSGRYVVDARSIMGIFSLDISKVLDFHVHTMDENVIKELRSVLADYLV